MHTRLMHRRDTVCHSHYKKCPTHLEVLIHHEVTADQVKEPEAAVELGLDSEEALGHDLLHAFLMHENAGK